MRIVTRPDFDGIVCAVLLYEAESITEPVKWLEPGEVQKGLADIRNQDILANLPYDDRCLMWFDHHYTNQTDRHFNGVFRLAPSAAGIIYEYYRDRYNRDYGELVAATDRIDSATFTLDEVLHPDQYPYILLSMTIFGKADEQAPYWNTVVALMRKFDIHAIMSDPEIKERCHRQIVNNTQHEQLLRTHTRVKDHVSITDFRELDPMPHGNRFLVYSIFPETHVNVCLLNDDTDKEKILVKLGHSIFNKTCRINVGQLLSEYGGGGHRGAGSCRLNKTHADDHIQKIINVLAENKSAS